MDKEIEKELWKGKIAVVIKLHKDDVTSLEETPPLLVRDITLSQYLLSTCKHTQYKYRYQYHAMDSFQE